MIGPKCTVCARALLMTMAFSGSLQASDFAQEIGALSAPRATMGAIAVAGKIMFAGGGYTIPGGADVPSDIVDIYDTAADEWSTAHLSQARSYLSAASVGDTALFAGGNLGGGNSSNVVDIYDGVTGQWRTGMLSQARYVMATASLEQKVFFAGGGDGTGPSAAVDVFDADSGGWTTAILSQARSYLCAASVGHVALFAGGSLGSGVRSDRVDIYDAVADSWSTSALSSPRTGMAAASVGHFALFAGGFGEADAWNHYSASAAVDIYDAQTGQWSVGQLSEPRCTLAAATIGNWAIFGGGGDGEGNKSDVVDIWNAVTGQWTTATLSEARYWLSAAAAGDKVMFAGGIASGGYSDRVDVFVVPEPATLSLLALGGLAALRRRE